VDPNDGGGHRFGSTGASQKKKKNVLNPQGERKTLRADARRPWHNCLEGFKFGEKGGGISGQKADYLQKTKREGKWWKTM